MTLTIAKYCKRWNSTASQGTVSNNYLTIQIKEVRMQQSDTFIL